MHSKPQQMGEKRKNPLRHFSCSSAEGSALHELRMVEAGECPTETQPVGSAPSPSLPKGCQGLGSSG